MVSDPEPIDQQQSPVEAQVAVPPPVGRPKQKRPLFGTFVLLILLLVLAGSLVANFVLLGVVGLAALETDGRIQEKFFSHQEKGEKKIAIISIEGAILDGEGFFKRQVDQAIEDAEDGNLKAVVLRVNSPGGTITGSDYMYHHLHELVDETGIPLVVSMGGIAASGGYYVSMAVGDEPDVIFAEPTTWTGSIGVVIPHYNLSELLEEWGIKEDSIVSHRLKTMGSFSKPMTEEERRILQGLVDAGFSRFKEVVQAGRPKFRKDPKALDKLATGQIFTAGQAKENGLIDRIGFIEDAVDRAIELARLDPENVRVVKYKPEPTLVDVLMGTRSQPGNLDLASLLDMTAPRAYYLCTWLPATASSNKH